MKKAICLLMLVIFLPLAFASCSLATNSIHIAPLYLTELNGEQYFLSDNWYKNYKIDFECKTISLVENDELSKLNEEKNAENAFVFQQFHGSYNDIENDALKAHLEACELTNGHSLVNAFGYWQEEILVGFVQVYEKYAKTCSGYDTKNIDHSLLFSYDANSDTFSVIKEVEDVVMVAFDLDTVIYWKDKAYYAYDLQTEEETYLVEDKAYDGGTSSWSTPVIYFNEEMCLLHLVKGELKGDKEYTYIFDFETNEFFELAAQ